MTEQAKLEREVSKLTNFTEIVRKFVQRLGDPSKFTYEGECLDLGGPNGKCTCDHPIRYMFLIHGPNGEVAPCGSECINHFASYNPGLFARLEGAKEGLFAKMAEDEKARKEALRQAELNNIKPEFDAAVAKFNATCEKIRRTAPSWKRYPLPYQMWRMEVALTERKEYKLTTSYIKFYNKMIGEINKLLASYERGELR